VTALTTAFGGALSLSLLESLPESDGEEGSKALFFLAAAVNESGDDSFEGEFEAVSMGVGVPFLIPAVKC